MLLAALNRTTRSMLWMSLRCSAVTGPLPTMARVLALAGAMFWQSVLWEPMGQLCSAFAKLVFHSCVTSRPRKRG